MTDKIDANDLVCLSVNSEVRPLKNERKIFSENEWIFRKPFIQGIQDKNTRDTEIIISDKSCALLNHSSQSGSLLITGIRTKY